MSKSKERDSELAHVVDLLKLKNEGPDGLERDQKFLSSSLNFLQKYPECVWCQFTAICGELLRLFSFKESPPSTWFREKTAECLASCRACIEAYYRIRPKVFSSFRRIYKEDAVKDFERQIYGFDVQRLQGVFQTYLNDEQSRKKTPFKFALFEVLLFPGWIVSRELSIIFENVMLSIISSQKMIKLSEKLPGLIACSVHPNSSIRSWAKCVLESLPPNSSSSIMFINFTWDTIMELANDLGSDFDRLSSLSVAIKYSDLSLISSCSDWKWTGRITFSLKLENDLVPHLLLFESLVRKLREIRAFDWSSVPDFYSSIEEIFGNSVFENYAMEQNGNAINNENGHEAMLNWIDPVVEVYMRARLFKIAHKMVSELVSFVVEGRSQFKWKVQVANRFCRALALNVPDAYLLGKICQVVFYFHDKGFDPERVGDETGRLIQDTCEFVFDYLVMEDCKPENSAGSLSGVPSSAIFDADNYRKYCAIFEVYGASPSLLNRIGNSLAALVRNIGKAQGFGFWSARSPLISFIFNQAYIQKDLSLISSDYVLTLLFIYLCDIKLLTQFTDFDSFWLRLLRSCPDRCLSALTETIPILTSNNYKLKGNLIPLERTLSFFNNILLRAFRQDPQLLTIYSDRLGIISKFLTNCVMLFYLQLDTLSLLSGGSVFFELSQCMAEFSLILLCSPERMELLKFIAKSPSPESISSKLLPCVEACLTHIHQRANRSKFTDVPSLVRLAHEFISICGYAKIDLESSRVNSIIRVILTTNTLPQYKSVLTEALGEYSKSFGRNFTVPAQFVGASAPTNSNASPAIKFDEALARKLNMLEKMDNDFFARNLPTSAHDTTSETAIPSRPYSKLGQLRQEMAKDKTLMATNAAKKTRFTPIIVQKAPKMQTSRDSSDSDSEREIHSNIFVDDSSATATSAGAKTSAATHASRSVKLIDLNGNEESAEKPAGVPISSKAFQFNRDQQRQDTQKLQKFLLSLNFKDLNENALDSEASFQTIPNSFLNHEHYIKVFEPLLQLECRSQLIQAKEEAEGRLKFYRAHVQLVSMVDDFHDITLNFGNDSVHRVFTEQDVLVGHPIRSSHGETHRSQADTEPNQLLGLVTQISSRQNGFEVTVRFHLKGCRSGSEEVILLTRLKQSWRFSKLCNMITCNREYLALQNLMISPSAMSILQPKFASLDASMSDRISKMKEAFAPSFNLNMSQAQAIAYALVNPNFFTLIQGPPGTGKTRTIEGFLAALFGRPRPEYRAFAQHCKRVLVCAPSNAAIDEIVRRIKLGVKDAYGQRMALRILRIGSMEMIHEDVKDLSIDARVEAMVESHINPAVQMLESNKKQMTELKGKMDDCVDDESKRRELQSSYWQLKENIRKGTRFIEDARQNLRIRILNEAQVVCCTLSAAGHELVGRIEGDFEMVIIDEACQAVELSALIPLQYGCRRAVLIGDPNQLPPTVISRTASAFTYEQSLFQRLQNVGPSAVQLLSMQYRMHPEIAAFPSAYFYGGRLADGANVERDNRRPWHEENPRILGPCRFFDIQGSERLRSLASGRLGKSMMNELEAEVAVSLIALLSITCPNYNFNGKIGIITPYKEQRRVITRELVERFGASILQAVEVSTVDGYQGQEKEVIIFSCVRTGEKAGIGFLNDARRLNVAITRAKCSLFLLGKSTTLVQNPLWRELIEDARKRGIFIPYDDGCWRDLYRERPFGNIFPPKPSDK